MYAEGGDGGGDGAGAGGRETVSGVGSRVGVGGVLVATSWVLGCSVSSFNGASSLAPSTMPTLGVAMMLSLGEGSLFAVIGQEVFTLEAPPATDARPGPGPPAMLPYCDCDCCDWWDWWDWCEGRGCCD